MNAPAFSFEATEERHIYLVESQDLLIAFALMDVTNISLGISHAPGPIPKLKKARYTARMITKRVVSTSSFSLTK